MGRSRLAMDWKIKHVLDHDGAGDKGGELHPDNGDNRDQGIGQDVPPKDAALRQAGGARRAGKVLPHDLKC